jgi:hypothetical protein
MSGGGEIFYLKDEAESNVGKRTYITNPMRDNVQKQLVLRKLTWLNVGSDSVPEVTPVLI